MVTETHTPAKPQVLRNDRVMIIGGLNFDIESDRVVHTHESVTWYLDGQEVLFVPLTNLRAIRKL